MTERFLPGRHLIDSFGNGGFRLGGVSHVGSIMIAPSGVRALDLANIASLAPEHVNVLIAEKDQIDMLIVGTGRDMLPMQEHIVQHLRAAGLGTESMSTNAAVRTYNVVLAENRRIAAIIIAVDKAHG